MCVFVLSVALCDPVHTGCGAARKTHRQTTEPVVATGNTRKKIFHKINLRTNLLSHSRNIISENLRICSRVLCELGLVNLLCATCAGTESMYLRLDHNLLNSCLQQNKIALRGKSLPPWQDESRQGWRGREPASQQSSFIFQKKTPQITNCSRIPYPGNRTLALYFCCNQGIFTSVISQITTKCESVSGANFPNFFTECSRLFRWNGFSKGWNSGWGGG